VIRGWHSMQPDRCLRVCLLGEPATGASGFLRAYEEACGGAPRPSASFESLVAVVDLDGEPWRARLVDNARALGGARAASLASAHAVLLCFSMDRPESLEQARKRWLPELWAAGEAPCFLLGLRSDLLAKPDVQGVDDDEAMEVAHLMGAMGFLECSALFPETVSRAMEECLSAAKAYHGLQWQLQLDPGEAERPPSRHPVAEAREEIEGAAWLTHERLNVSNDPRVLEVEDVKNGLSTLGLTHSGKHAYLRVDVPEKGLTSVDALRPYRHLQFVNVSKNQLCTLEPLGALRGMLHLNASQNLLIRTQNFTAPDALETVDLSYNLISSLGEWGVHKYLRELNLRGNFLDRIGPGLRRNAELQMLDLSENHIPRVENLEGLGLRVLLLAQNQLTSLQGVGALGMLQSLSARHNNITSIAELRAEELPRLRKLCVSENRLSGIKEVDGLQGFHFLCDLALVPNPLAQLPHYRAQVIHRLPRLRVLDGQAVPAEEKVKADLIYGADVEARTEIFKQLLPEETFVDRRLVTAEGIMEQELEAYGAHGEAGPFGQPLEATKRRPSEPLPRTPLQEAALRRRLEQVRRGGRPAGTADLTSWPAPFLSPTVHDSDLAQVFEAVAEGRVERLLLGDARLTPTAIREIVAFLRTSAVLRHVDLAGCVAVGQIGDSLADGFPFARGCSLEVAGCGLLEETAERLRNRTDEAQEALSRVAQERQRTTDMIAAYMAQQGALEEFAAFNREQDEPPPLLPPPLCHPVKWCEGADTTARAAYDAFRAANPEGLKCEQVAQDLDEFEWSMMGKDGSRVTLDLDEYVAMLTQRNDMLVEWGCCLSVEADEGEGYDEVPSAPGSGRFRPDGVPLPGSAIVLTDDGRPLPEAYEAAFSPVMHNDRLLAFMLWAGVGPSPEVVAARREVVAARRAEVVEQEERLARLRLERQAEWEAQWRAEQERLSFLSDAAKKLYDGPLAAKGIASGQIIAHFTYLCLGGTLKGNEELQPLTRFGLKLASKVQRPAPKRGLDLHKAVADGKVAIEAASGKSFGVGSVTLRLRNDSDQPLEIAVRRGSVFQHIAWEHRQNLLVCVDYVVPLPPAGSALRHLDAYCMNLSCACSSGNPMSLTDFFFDKADVLESQGRVWDHFQQCFGLK